MSRTYQVNQSADIALFVRILVRDGAGIPTAGLTIPFVLRDVTGFALSSGSAVDIAGAPGWYTVPPLVLPVSGTYTVEFAVPVPFVADDDTAVIQVPDLPPIRKPVYDTALIGENYRFNVLFTDRDNAPLSVSTPTIEIYNYDSGTGDRVTLVAPGTAMVATTPPAVGRYIFLYLVDDTSEEGDKLYAEIQAGDPTPGGLGVLRYDYILNLTSVRIPGLGTSFVE